MIMQAPSSFFFFSLSRTVRLKQEDKDILSFSYPPCFFSPLSAGLGFPFFSFPFFRTDEELMKKETLFPFPSLVVEEVEGRGRLDRT